MTTYRYPNVAVDKDLMILNGGKHPEAVLVMDWQKDVPEIQKVSFGGMEIPYEQVDVMFELNGENKSANLMVWNKVGDLTE